MKKNMIFFIKVIIVCDFTDRTRNLIGEEALACLKKKHIAVFGLGGVGSYLTEALARSGVGELTLIDKDQINVTNINRQLYALQSTIGQLKTEVARKRIADINPDCKVHTISQFYLPENREIFFLAHYDYICDAIDTVTAKIDLVLTAKEKNIQIPEIVLKVQNRTDPRLQELETYLDTYQIKVDYGDILYTSLEDFSAMRATIDYYKDVVSDQNLSPLEQTMMVYDVIKSFVYNESPEDTANSRYIPKIIKTGNIVCTGYSSLLTQVLQELGIPATSYTVVLEPEQDKVVYHARTLIRLDDEKYKIHGIYTLDATWDSQRKELSTVTSKEGKEEIRYEREEGDTLIKDYDSLALYRNFLVPYKDYRNLYKTDSKPAIFDEVDYDLGLTEKEPYTDTAEEQRQILFPNETKAIEQKIILDTKKPSLEAFTQALRTVRKQEGYLEDSISEQVNDVVELNQMVETLYNRPQTFFPSQTKK